MAHARTAPRRRTGWPEVGLLAVLGLAIVLATSWWSQHYRAAWPSVGGVVVSASLAPKHYNAEDYRTHVVVDYEFTVGMARFTGRFDGHWPAVGGPNALPPEELESRLKAGTPVQVYYHPSDPARSVLHPERVKASPYLFLAMLVAIGMATLYTFVVYPRLRRTA